jgi:hypothetical protein
VRGAKVVISQHPRPIPQIAIDLECTNGVTFENFFCKLKEFKRIAMRAARSQDGTA